MALNSDGSGARAAFAVDAISADCVFVVPLDLQILDATRSVKLFERQKKTPSARGRRRDAEGAGSGSGGAAVGKKKASGEARLWGCPSDRHGPSAFAVGMLRKAVVEIDYGHVVPLGLRILDATRPVQALRTVGPKWMFIDVYTYV